MPAGFTKSLSDRLNWQSKITVHEAEDGMFIKPGHAIKAKGGLHMEVGGSGEKPYIVLSDTPPRQSLKPNADIMMESVAKVFKERSVAVVLTGMGSDGTKGASAIQRMGGKVLVEDESSCVVAGMPGSVIKAGLADQVYPIHRIARAMKKMMRS